jgi:tetratricopeptide (TPR) repeat protein
MKKELKKSPVKVIREAKKNTFSKEHYYLFGIIIIFTFLLYGNTIFNDYALDDSYVITQNDFTKKGFNGIIDILSKDFFSGRYEKYGKNENIVTGGRYRPLSVITFAIEYQLFKENPHISHFINIILYAFTSIILFLVLQRLLTQYDKEQKWYLSVSFIATLLFIAHPLHTEVVANIKGRDEIMSLLGSLLTLLMVLKYHDSGRLKYLFYSFIYFFLGLMSKENTITFLAVIPLSVHFFSSVQIKKNLSVMIPAAFATLFFLIIRQSVLGTHTGEAEKELMNNPFLNAGYADRYATVFYTLGLYIKLLFFPHPLTFDYYPYHIPIINWTDLRAIIPLIVNIALVIYAFYGLKKKKIVSYGLWFYFAALSIASNLFFPIGVFMNERFVFASSIGFCIIIAYWLMLKLATAIKNTRLFTTVSIGLITIILVLYSGTTISRNTVWKDNKTLFRTDVITSSNSVKSNSGLGEILYHEGEKVTDINARKEILKESIKYLKKAVSIHPDYVNALILLANAYFEYNRNTDTTIMYYLRIIRVSPRFQDVYTNLPVVLKTIPDIDKRIKVYEEVYSLNPNRSDVCYELGVLYGKEKKDYQKAVFYLERSVSLQKTDGDIFNNLGMAYGMAGNLKKALENFQRAESLNPNSKQVLSNLAITYQQLGETQKARYYFEKVKAVQ